MANDLHQRTLAALAEAPDVESGGADGLVPGHGTARGVKFLVPDGDPPEFEGGSMCRCGEVFVRSFSDGGMRAAEEAMFQHWQEAARPAG